MIALSRGNPRARAFLARAIQAGAEVLIPSVVVAETVRGRGPRDAPVNRVIAAVGDVPVADEPVARIAGALLGSAASDATIDAIVVATAEHARGGRVLTADPQDCRRLARGSRAVTIHAL